MASIAAMGSLATNVQKSSIGIGNEKTANFVDRFIKLIYGNQ
jgi:hypothetical protein